MEPSPILLAPIISLISKSEKAIQKLTPGLWQHTMLKNNLQALHFALALMKEDIPAPEAQSVTEIQEYLKALSSMVTKTEHAQLKFSPGSSQYSLLQNRLNALQAASAVVRQM